MTLEIASDAESVDGDWSWRLSIADVAQRGFFSRYDGIDRMLMVLDGQGLVIERGEKIDLVPSIDSALTFAGEEEVIGVPAGPGVRDVNFMVRRERWRGSLHIVRNGRMLIDAPTVLVHAARGKIALSTPAEPEVCLLIEEQTFMCSGRIEIKNKLDCAAIVCQLWPTQAP